MVITASRPGARRRDSARGAILPREIADLAFGMVDDHRIEPARGWGRGDGVALDGAFTLSPRQSGLTIHASDTTPRQDFEACFVAPAGVSVMVLLEGFVEGELDGEPFSLGADEAPQSSSAQIRVLSRPARIRRRARRGVRVRKVNIDVGPVWLADCERSGAGPSAEIAAFLGRHLAHAHWAPSPRAIHSAERILTPAESDFIGRLTTENCALDILGEAFGMLEGCVADAPASTRDAGRARAAMSFVDDHCLEDLSLPEIAAAVGMSVSALQRAVKRAYGCTVAERRRMLRLARARAALLFDGATVGEAASLAGYASATNFATAFARRFGAPPSRLKG